MPKKPQPGRTLFDVLSAPDHVGERERVSARIASAILAFCRAHKVFHADDLRRYVVEQTGTAAPASADRILRMLRTQGALDYKVLSRQKSLYEVLSVKREDS